MQTAERVSHTDLSDNYVYQRSALAYVKAAEMISGNVLEIGTGSGYGVDYISPKCTHFTTIDKFDTQLDLTQYSNVSFIKMNIPPFTNMADNSFDFVITFQVIEHIEDDHLFLKEINRVLKPGGKLIVTTPNKKMSITRNPWHVREYTVDELVSLMSKYFSSVNAMGVFGKQNIMDYYEANKKSVQRITRFDLFNLQYRLPRWMLQIPYDLLNRMNRKKLLNDNNSLVASIKMEDYYVDKANDGCFDLFYVGVK